MANFSDLLQELEHASHFEPRGYKPTTEQLGQIKNAQTILTRLIDMLNTFGIGFDLTWFEVHRNDDLPIQIEAVYIQLKRAIGHIKPFKSTQYVGG